MKTNSEKNRSKTSYRKWFILLPVVFLLCGYLLLFASLAPILDPLLSVYRLAFANANVQTIDEPGAGSVFNGTTGLTQGVLNWDDFEFPAYGEAFGRITVEGTEIDTDVIYGDSTTLLNRGACMSLYSHIPRWCIWTQLTVLMFTKFIKRRFSKTMTPQAIEAN